MRDGQASSGALKQGKQRILEASRQRWKWNICRAEPGGLQACTIVGHKGGPRGVRCSLQPLQLGRGGAHQVVHVDALQQAAVLERLPGSRAGVGGRAAQGVGQAGGWPTRSPSVQGRRCSASGGRLALTRRWAGARDLAPGSTRRLTGSPRRAAAICAMHWAAYFSRKATCEGLCASCTACLTRLISYMACRADEGTKRPLVQCARPAGGKTAGAGTTAPRDLGRLGAGPVAQ